MKYPIDIERALSECEPCPDDVRKVMGMFYTMCNEAYEAGRVDAGKGV